MMRLAAVALCAAAAAAAQLEHVASFGWEKEPTGVAVNTAGRVFVSFPRWFRNFTGPSVAEVIDGELQAYPSAGWNEWSEGDDPKAAFVCVQSVFVDHFDRLWVLDPGAAYITAVVPGAPKLLHFDLSTNRVVRVYRFNSTVAPLHSYLNDVRISRDGRTAFMTDSNSGGLHVLDLSTGNVRSVLMSHPSTHAEAGALPTVEGQPLYLAGSNPPSPVTFQSDGIAVLGDYVYYHAVTAWTLYRINATLLADHSTPEHTLGSAVERVARSGFHDGMVAAADRHLNGVLYMTALEKDGIDFLTDDGRVLPLLSDARLQWPDSMSVPVIEQRGEPVYLYVTASQVQFQPFIASPRSRTMQYGLYRVRLQ